MINLGIEWITDDIGIVRGGEDWTYGKPYQLVCTVIREGSHAHIIAYLGIYNRTIRKQMFSVLKDVGVSIVTFERMNQKTRRLKEIILD